MPRMGVMMHWYTFFASILIKYGKPSEVSFQWTITGPVGGFFSQSVFPCLQVRGPAWGSLWLVWNFLSFSWPCWRILHFPALKDPTASTSSHSTVVLLTYLRTMTSLPHLGEEDLATSDKIYTVCMIYLFKQGFFCTSHLLDKFSI